MLRAERSLPGVVGLFGCLVLLVLATAGLLLASMTAATRAAPVVAVGLSAFVLGNVLFLELPLRIFFEEPGQFLPVVGALIMLGGPTVQALTPAAPAAR